MVEVRGHVRQVGITENALQVVIGCRPETVIDFVGGCWSIGFEGQVDHRDVRRWHPDGNAVEPSGKLRQHQPDRPGCTGRGRYHRHRCRTRPVQILVHGIEGRLVAGIAVDGGHETAPDADGFGKHPRHRRQTVCRA